MSDTFPDLWHTEPPEPALRASRHVATGELAFPPLPSASPLAPHHVTVAVAPDGVVYSHTVIYPNPKSGQSPHALAYVDLDGPIRVFGRFVDGARPAIGARCRVVPHATYGYAFRAVEEAA